MLMYENPCLQRKLTFCEKWREDQSALPLIFKLLWALHTQIKRHYKENLTHNTIVKFKNTLNVLDILS